RQDIVQLRKYFKKVHDGSIPNDLFNDKRFPRVSQFKLRGIKSSFVKSFSKQLIRSGKITKFDTDSKLSNYARRVYDNYKENHINKKPGHEPILKNILIKDKDSVAIEVPIWKKVKNNSYVTGHIDLIQVDNNHIKVIDYKPEGKFLISLPQVAVYGLLARTLLNIKNLKCISFNKDKAWEYSPNLILELISKSQYSKFITGKELIKQII
ncbi:unnamed protein product, partial [marine sediment metagenome]